MCDANIFYAYNLEMYPGRQQEGSYQQNNKPTDVVERLTPPMVQEDSWFSDVKLAIELKEQRFSLVETIKKSK